MLRSALLLVSKACIGIQNPSHIIFSMPKLIDSIVIVAVAFAVLVFIVMNANDKLPGRRGSSCSSRGNVSLLRRVDAKLKANFLESSLLLIIKGIVSALMLQSIIATLLVYPEIELWVAGPTLRNSAMSELGLVLNELP